MANNASNVVRLTSAGRDPSQRIINECRDRLAESLSKWLQGIGADVAEELFVLADGTRDRLKQTQYLDLRRDVEREWEGMASACRRAFKESKPVTSVSLDMPDFDGLSLVEDAELSESIVIREFAARLAETCDEELYGLDRRIALVLDAPEEDIEHPLRPQAICDALAAGCAVLTARAEDRTLILRRIERHLHGVLPGLYRDINTYLADMGLLPDLKRSYRRSTAPNAHASTPEQAVAAAAALASSLPNLGESVTAPMAAADANNFLGALQRLAAARSGSAFPAAPLPLGMATMGLGLGIPAESTSLAPGEMGHGGTSATPDAIADAAALSQAFFSSLDQFRPAEGGATTNQIHLIRASEAARQVGHVEAVTIDIVAMLFDFIFEDTNVPDGVKALVGRLQIPVLKLAMQDQTFFANRSHPARHFLDEISGIALRWGGSVDINDPFYRTLAELIDRIQDGFENDIEIFSRALEELQKFVDEQTAVEEQSVQAAADLAAQREREVEAWERAQATTKELCLGELPEVVRAFAWENWMPVLQKLALEHDETSTAWTDATSLIGDIAQSVIPKKTAEERMALIKVLPALLGRINRGLDLVSTDKSERRPFFDTLVDLHTAALKGEAPAPEAVAAPEADTAETPAAEEPAAIDVPAAQDNAEGDLIVTRSQADGVEIEEIALVGAKPVWRADDRDINRRVALLQRGDWVEFRQEEGASIRERLTWISPQRRILMFSNHHAAKAISVAPDALAKMIRSGQATIVEEESLFERAMHGVLENLNAA